LSQLNVHGASLHDIAHSLLSSVEFKKAPSEETELLRFNDLRVYAGYSKEDLEIFSNFNTQGVGGAPGFVTDWIGSRVRTSSLWDGCERLDGAVTPIPVPGDYHSEAVEWIGALKAVLAADTSFSVMELGAGHGPWLSAACAAARSIGIRELHICGVEADPGRFALLQQNLRDNALADSDVQLHQAAIGVEAGHARWPRIEDPRNVAGGRPNRPGNVDDQVYLAPFNNDMIDVDIIALGPLLRQRPVWDLVHIDVQGTEAELCQGCIDDLSRHVRYLVIGTHSRKLDGDLLAFLLEAGWSIEHEKPTQMGCAKGLPLPALTMCDGTQVWRNPRV
jgi:FkbM family methyltransferase